MVLEQSASHSFWSVRLLGKGKKCGNVIAYVVVSLLLIVGCFWGYGKILEVPKRQVDILFLGDSLIGQHRDETSIPYLVGEQLEMSVYNGAFGGTCMSKINVGEERTLRKEGLNFISLARAIAYDDFRVQQATVIREPATEHFAQVVDEMEQIDFENLKYLILEYGTNDYFAGVPVNNQRDPYDAYTFEGALRSSLEILRKSLPDVQIILISPTYNWYLNTMETCENKEFGGGYLSEYVDVISQIAEEYGMEYIDLYTDFYPRTAIEEALIYTSDGIHPNVDGRVKIAHAIAEYIENK